MGDPEVDHNCWERPEAMTEKRPLVQVNMSFPGTEVAAETAAANRYGISINGFQENRFYLF